MSSRDGSPVKTAWPKTFDSVDAANVDVNARTADDLLEDGPATPTADPGPARPTSLQPDNAATAPDYDGRGHAAFLTALEAFKKSCVFLTKVFEISFLLIALYVILEFSLPAPSLCNHNTFSSCVRQSRDLSRLETNVLTSDCNSVFKACQDNNFIEAAKDFFAVHPTSLFVVAMADNLSLTTHQDFQWSVSNTSGQYLASDLSKLNSVAAYLNFCDCIGSSAGICSSLWRGIALLIIGIFAMGVLLNYEGSENLSISVWGFRRAASVGLFFLYSILIFTVGGCDGEEDRIKYVVEPLVSTCMSCTGVAVGWNLFTTLRAMEALRARAAKLQISRAPDL
jgi:hypothetical protein